MLKKEIFPEILNYFQTHILKDFIEYKLTSLIFGLLNGWDITFAGYLVPTAINEAISKNFWMYLFNFDFFMFFDEFTTPYQV